MRREKLVEGGSGGGKGLSKNAKREASFPEGNRKNSRGVTSDRRPGLA